MERAEAARDEILGMRMLSDPLLTVKQANVPIHIIPCDNMSFKSVRNFCKSFLNLSLVTDSDKGLNGRLDFLLCNAGLAAVSTEVSEEDGYECQIQTNYLGHFLMVKELFGRMVETYLRDCQSTNAKSSERPRVIIHTSTMHLAGYPKFLPEDAAEGSDPRRVGLSDIAHGWGGGVVWYGILFILLGGDSEKVQAWKRYAISKLANVLFS